MTYTLTTTESFTLTNAKKLAAKVIADMYQCRRLYGKPSESDIENYQTELVVLLAGRYVAEYEFGFKTSADKRIVSWPATLKAGGPAGSTPRRTSATPSSSTTSGAATGGARSP